MSNAHNNKNCVSMGKGERKPCFKLKNLTRTDSMTTDPPLHWAKDAFSIFTLFSMEQLPAEIGRDAEKIVKTSLNLVGAIDSTYPRDGKMANFSFPDIFLEFSIRIW